jgi:stringent starvation protein B
VKSQRPYLLRALYAWIIDSDEVPYVLVDTTIAGVHVPPEHIQDGQIVLNLGPDAVRDLIIDDEFVSCGGRFGGQRFELYLPMASIRAVYAKDMDQGMVLPDDPLPDEAAGPDVAADIDEQPATPDKPTLRLV